MSNNKKKKPKRPSKKRVKAQKPSLGSRFSNWWQEQSISLQFLGLFALMIGLFYTFYFSNFNIEHIHPYILAAQAKLGAFLLNLTGQSVTATDHFINGSAFSVNISGGCDGLEVTALLVAGMLAFPSTWREKWRGLLYGVGILTVMNIIRLPVLYFTGAKGSMALFEFLHVQGGFVIFISISILIWGYWVIKVLNQRKIEMAEIGT